MKKISFESLLANALFLLALFPYISPINTPFDTQPYAISLSGVMFSIYIMKKRDDMPKPLFLIMMLLPYLVLLLLTTSSDFMSGLRSLVGYFSLFFIGFAAYQSFHLVMPKLLLRAAWVWFILGIIQFTVYKQFGDFLLPRISTSEARGVTSLAVEPSYYAIMMVFMIILNEFFYAKGHFDKKQYFTLLVLCSVQILLSYSGMGFMFFIIIAMAKAIAAFLTQNLARKIKRSLSVGVAITLLLVAFTYIPKLAYSRAGLLLSGAISDPSSILYYDYSIAQRLSHIVISSLSIFQNYGLGFGLGDWEQDVNHVLSNMPLPVWSMIMKQGVDPSGRIMSGWGSAIFELGVIGLIPLLLFIYIAMKGIKRFKQLKYPFVMGFIVVFILMWMAIPFSFPLFGYFIGLMMYYIYRGRHLEKASEERVRRAG
jgi:hypothetical protein